MITQEPQKITENAPGGILAATINLQGWDYLPSPSWYSPDMYLGRDNTHVM